jgi:sterol desaturase/sphingolipid hydroxylase (fatty acid hydroxylase superfamily)
MELLDSDMMALRIEILLGLVCLLITVEWLVPFRAPLQSKLEHASTNLVIFGSNSLVAQMIAGWVLLVWSSYVTSEAWGLLYRLRLDLVSNVVLSVILLDGVSYGIHRLYHRVPVLWRLHRAHHSDLDIDSTTSVRFHLIEVLLTTAIKGFSVLALGIQPVGYLISETATFAAGLFSHGNLKLPSILELWLRLVIVTPPMHWIHHSRRQSEHNTNLGAVFSGWDRLFGTYFMGVQQRHIKAGLDEYPTPKDVTFLRFQLIPFDGACRRVQ